MTVRAAARPRRRRVLLLALPLLGTSVASADVAAPAGASTPMVTLCRTGESVVFECPVARGRRVAVCGSADLTTTAGSLQYRFGRAAQLELQWPPVPAADWRSQVKAGQVMYAGGGGAYLRFAAPAAEYVVYSAVGRGWGRKAGVMVLQDGQQKSVQRCRAPARSRLGPALARQAGLAEDAEELELPPP